MTAETFRISARLQVTITSVPDGLHCLWDPAVPARLTCEEQRRYLAAVTTAIADRLSARGVYVQ